MRVRSLLIPILLSLALLGAMPFASYAQSSELSASERAALAKQLADLEREIASTQKTIDALSSEGESLKRDIAILDGEIKKAKLRVRATEVAISQLTGNIRIHTRNISTLTTKLTDEKESLAQIVRNTQQIDDYSLIEVIMSTENISDFFSDLDSFAAVKQALYSSFDQIIETRAASENEKVELEGERLSQQQLRQLHVLEQQKVEEQEAEKRDLLAKTKGQEALYRQLKNAQELTAAQIRAKLFPLRDTQGIQFGTAVEHAKTASRITGVRPALILAILSQESDLGKNVGQCLITDLATGDGKGKNTGTPFPGTMKVPRDTVPFERIMNALGRDWSTTPISCPLPGGYGGAMGPTQFIPSTWAGYENRIKSALGVAASDPWNPLHAITATGLYLADLGAGAQTYDAEHRAAAQYYAGGNWATSGQGYASSVMSKAANFQHDIDIISGN
ncbi:MAG TPA: lytic murein transglycosylase [Candidatus Paceibacterota bacterium]|nr:lytic murein transglycosylase [Candidatus Paceibacterota bacterium]